MKTLVLIRHAHAETFSAAGLDEGRDLSTRGMQEAIKLAKNLKKHAASCKKILASHANRAKQTATILAREGLCPVDKIEIINDIYETSHTRLIEILRGLNANDDIVYLVGHNPTIYDCAMALSQPLKGSSGNKMREQLSFGFQPANAVLFTYDKLEDWGLIDTTAPTDFQMIAD